MLSHCVLVKGVLVKGDKVHSRGLPLAWLLCFAQALTTALAVLVVWTTSDGAAAIAALFGGVIVMVPALYFGARVGLSRHTSQPKEILGTFYQAAIGKLLLTALLFFVGALLFGKHFAPLMITSVACLAMNWVMLAVARID